MNVMRKAILSLLCALVATCVLGNVAAGGGCDDSLVVTHIYDGQSLDGLDYKLDSIVRRYYGESVFNASRSRYGLVFFDEFDLSAINPRDTVYGLLMVSKDGSNYAFRTKRLDVSHSHFRNPNRAVHVHGTSRDTITFPNVDTAPVWPYVLTWDIDGMQRIWGHAIPAMRKVEHAWHGNFYAFRIYVDNGLIDGISVQRMKYCYATGQQLARLTTPDDSRR